MAETKETKCLSTGDIARLTHHLVRCKSCAQGVWNSMNWATDRFRQEKKANAHH